MTRHRFLPFAWLLVVLLLAGHNAWLWMGKRIVPNTDIMALLPAQEQDVVLQRSFSKMVDAAQQKVIVLVGASDWDAARKAARAYTAVLDRHPALIERQALDAGTQSAWLDGFSPHRLTLLSAADEARLGVATPQEWQGDAMARLYSAFGGPKLGAFRDDPFGLFANWMQERAQETPVRPRDGWLFVAEGSKPFILLPLTMKGPALSLSAQQALLPVLEQARMAAAASGVGVEVLSAGVVLHAAAAGAQAEREVSTIGIGSLLGIILLTWLMFRSFLPIGMVLATVAVGFLGALSLCWMLFGQIHLLTLVFGASLVGVAQDYGIYYLSNRLGADDNLSSADLLRRLLPGLALTLLAAVVGYMGLALTPFPGLRHMAVFSALGLVFAWVTVVCWFPSLVAPGRLRAGPLAAPYTRLLAKWPRWRPGRAGWIALGGAALFIAAGLVQLRPNDDIRQLQNPPKALIEQQIRLGKMLDAPSPVQYYLVRAASEQAVLEKEEALKRRLAALVDEGVIRGVHAISNWVPSKASQQARSAKLDAHLLNADGPLAGLAAHLGEDAAWAAGTAAGLRAAGKPFEVSAFLALPASEPWRHMWLGKLGGEYASVVSVRGISHAVLPRLAGVAEGMPGVQWVDKIGEISSVMGRYRTYMGMVLMGAYLVVLVFLLPRYRGDAWRVLAPTALASLLTLAMLGLAGQPLQLFHVLALMLLLGVGVDYGVFMQEPGGAAASATWMAVGLSAATTILSFGLLALSSTPALRAFGLAMLAGTALAWLLVPCFARHIGTRDETT